MGKLNKQRLLFGLFLIILIAVAEIVLHALHLPGWPAFMIMIFFFEAHMDIKKAPAILLGGLFGIVAVLAAKYFVIVLAPSMGAALPRLIFIIAFVYAIVALGEIIPLLFNNYAFMYILVTALAMQAKLPHPNPDLSLLIFAGVELVCGTLFIYGILGIIKLMGAMAKKG